MVSVSYWYAYPCPTPQEILIQIRHSSTWWEVVAMHILTTHFFQALKVFHHDMLLMYLQVLGHFVQWCQYSYNFWKSEKFEKSVESYDIDWLWFIIMFIHLIFNLLLHCAEFGIRVFVLCCRPIHPSVTVTVRLWDKTKKPWQLEMCLFFPVTVTVRW